MSGIEPWILASSIATTGVGMISGQAQAQAQAQAARQAAEYQRQMAENNALAAEQQADLEKKMAEKRLAAIRQEGAGQSGALRARMARSGVSLLDEDGSAMDVLGQVAPDYAGHAEAEKWKSDYAVQNLLHRAATYRHGGLLADMEGAARAGAIRSSSMSSLTQGLLGLTHNTLASGHKYNWW